jgi:hypothetical protein
MFKLLMPVTNPDLPSLTTSQDADPDIPILKEAKAECAKLH